MPTTVLSPAQAESAAMLAAIRENPPALLTVDPVATVLGCHTSNVYKMVANHVLPAVRVGRRAIRIPTVAFLAFIDGEG